MWQELLVIHRKSKEPFTHSPNAVIWSTCLRQLLFVLPKDLSEIEDQLIAEDQIKRGQEAYQLLLEVCCGLHSPILGETEVFGQFRDFFLKLPNTNPMRIFLRNMAEQIISDTKQVRQQHLLNLGAQSYGSLLRKTCSSAKSIAILGAGQLAEEILPWFQGKATMHLICRNQEQGRALAKSYTNIAVDDFDTKLPKFDAVVIAAPIPSSFLNPWLAKQELPNTLIDLRGEASVDPLLISAPDCIFLGLAEVFASIENQRSSQDARALQAKKQITLLTQRYFDRARSNSEHRPFGWDDVCA
jgi:glutamyl-tRNA reductase